MKIRVFFYHSDVFVRVENWKTSHEIAGHTCISDDQNWEKPPFSGPYGVTLLHHAGASPSLAWACLEEIEKNRIPREYLLYRDEMGRTPLMVWCDPGNWDSPAADAATKLKMEKACLHMIDILLENKGKDKDKDCTTCLMLADVLKLG